MSKKKTRPTPKAGSRYQHKVKGQIVYLEAIETADGIRFVIDGVPEIEFKSFTAAAKYLVPDGQPVNGPRYWNPIKTSD